VNIDEFWAVIEKGKDSDEPESIIKEELGNLSAEEIVSYQEHFDALFDKAYQWTLWGAAYVIGGGCSDDGFIDFRYGLISRGKDVYEKALENPDSLADLGSDAEIENELFGYVALEVHEEKIGKDMPRKDAEGIVEPTGEEWDFDNEDENNKRLPRLMKLFW